MNQPQVCDISAFNPHSCPSEKGDSHPYLVGEEMGSECLTFSRKPYILEHPPLCKLQMA